MHKYKFLLKDSNCRITQSDTLRWLLAAAPPPACCVWIPLLFPGICTCILEIRKYVSNLFMIWRVTLCCCVTYFFTYNIFPHLLLVSTFAPRPLFLAVGTERFRGQGQNSGRRPNHSPDDTGSFPRWATRGRPVSLSLSLSLTWLVFCLEEP